MKIGIINNLYKPYERGGAETVIETIKLGLEKKGHQVFVISSYPSFFAFKQIKIISKNYFLPSAYYFLNRMPWLLRFLWHFFKLFDPINLFKTRKILKKEEPDLILTHNLTAFSGFTSLLIKCLKIKQAHYLHDTQLLHPKGRITLGQEKLIGSSLAKMWQNLKKQQLKNIKYIISPSNWLLQKHLDKGFFPQAQTLVLLNPVIGEKLKREKFSLYTFVYLGSIDQDKGVPFLLTTFNNLSLKAQLIVIGKGPLLKNLQAKYKDTAEISFLSNLSHKEAMETISQCHCLISPSFIYENSPTVILEGLLAGLDIITSDIGGGPEIIKKFWGKQFKPGDRNSLSKKLLECLEGEKQKKNKEELKILSPSVYIEKISEFLEIS
ncbi:MAG: glycosyltransferase [Candidatus Pacebacteria bacterium]|nr:glycosyltransferase [Candidatus Paceibacterota bacterium]